MLEKIIRLIKYCRTINEGLSNTPNPILVAAEDQGSLALNSPRRAPLQIVISLPQASLSGNCDNMTGPHTLIIFALEKGRDQTRTAEQSDQLYMDTAYILEQLLAKFIDDISGARTSGQCPLLYGMELIEVEILPETGRFGGWDGWSAALVLK